MSGQIDYRHFDFLEVGSEGTSGSNSPVAWPGDMRPDSVKKSASIAAAIDGESSASYRWGIPGNDRLEVTQHASRSLFIPQIEHYHVAIVV